MARLENEFPNQDLTAYLWKDRVKFVRNAFNHHYLPGLDASDYAKPTTSRFVESRLDEYIPSGADLPLRKITMLEFDWNEDVPYEDEEDNRKIKKEVKWIDWDWKEHPAPPPGGNVPLYDKRDVDAVWAQRLEAYKTYSQAQNQEVPAEKSPASPQCTPHCSTSSSGGLIGLLPFEDPHGSKTSLSDDIASLFI
jgi:hypothetical protein